MFGVGDMNYLSLFSGAGGGDLASQHLLGWKCLGYVEWEDYCQRVLMQRQEDGYLDKAPIFGDIRTFTSDGYAEQYQGMVNVVTAGFPCQPFSVAGKQAGEGDPRNMWPATIEVIRLVRPQFCLLENVPGLLGIGYFGTILSDLAESGFDARWKVLSAAEVGAPHKRDRLWIVANTTRVPKRNPKLTGTLPEVKTSVETQSTMGKLCDDLVWPPSTLAAYWNTAKRNEGQPGVPRITHGLAKRLDRLKAIGNGQVSRVAATAWEILTEGL